MNFREVGAAEYLHVSRSLLRKLRRFSTGPSYARIGRVVVYRQQDLDAWLAAHLQPTSGEEKAK